MTEVDEIATTNYVSLAMTEVGEIATGGTQVILSNTHPRNDGEDRFPLSRE